MSHITHADAFTYLREKMEEKFSDLLLYSLPLFKSCLPFRSESLAFCSLLGGEL
jgi:hypothetical protein